MTDAEHFDERVWMRSVLDRFEGRLTRYATRIVGDVETARDVVQETFLRLCSDGAPRDDARVAQWLFTVCRNRALDVRRRDRRMKPLTVNETECFPDVGPPPHVTLERDETTSRLLRLLGELPDAQQEAIRLRFQGGLSYREIGGVMETTVGNVGYLLHTAIQTIRKRLDRASGPSSNGAEGQS